MTQTDVVSQILGRSYHRTLVPDEDSGVFFATIQEFEGCFAEGDTPTEAYDRLESVARAWLMGMLEQSLPIPEPLVDLEYSGRISLRLPKSLHQKAAETAEREGVSLNTFLVMAVGARVARSTSHTAIRGTGGGMVFGSALVSGYMSSAEQTIVERGISILKTPQVGNIRYGGPLGGIVLHNVGVEHPWASEALLGEGELIGRP